MKIHFTERSIKALATQVKAKTNLSKHGVSFDGASEIFLDPLHPSLIDEPSEQEQRWITLGTTKDHKLRLVAHTFLTYHHGQATVVNGTHYFGKSRNSS